MLAVEVLGDEPGGGEVGRALGADRERLQAPPALARDPRRDRRHERGVEAAGEEDADVDVAHHLLAHRAHERVARAGQQLLAVGDGRALRRHGGGEADEPLPGVQAQPGGNGSTSACHSGSNACISDAKRTAPFRRAQ